MCGAVVADAVQYGGCAGAYGLALFLFAVQYAEGVLFKAAFAGLAEAVVVAPEVLLEAFIIFWTAFGAAYAVDIYAEALYAHPVQHRHGKLYALGIYACPGSAVYLHAKLMMLPETARLGLIITEHGAVEIVHLGGLGVVEKAVLDEHTACARSALRLKGNGAAALVVKGVHFLLNDVGGVAHAPEEKLGMLYNRSTHFVKAKLIAHLARYFLDILPLVALGRYNVLCALGRLNCHDSPHILNYYLLCIACIKCKNKRVSRP